MLTKEVGYVDVSVDEKVGSAVSGQQHGVCVRRDVCLSRRLLSGFEVSTDMGGGADSASAKKCA